MPFSRRCRPRCALSSDPQEGVNNVRSEVNRAIWRLFKQHHVTMPVAQREILVRTAPPDPD
jgi:small-conductance mechanosensitive channel